MNCKPRGFLFCAFMLGVFALTSGCAKKVAVLPPAASPGQTVHIRHASANFKDPKRIEVTFAGRRGAVVRVADASTIVALVPSAEPGTVKVTVRDGKFVGTGSLQIRPAGKRRLFFTMENGEIRLDSVLPRSGSYSKPPKQGRRLSFDVLDAWPRAT
jgi:hypothetical protein